MRPGQRVFWHGITPRPEQQGTIRQTGIMRHEVLWDGDEVTAMEYPDCLMAVSQFGKCCTYCAALQEQGRSV